MPVLSTREPLQFEVTTATSSEDLPVSSHQAVAVEPHLVEVLLKALHRAEEPITATKLREGLTGPYKVALETVENQLSELVTSGRAFSFQPYGSKAPRYWPYDQEHYARQLVLKIVSRHPKTWSEVKKALRCPLKGFSDARQSKLQKDMLDSGELHKLPAFVGARASRFSNRPPEPSHYIEHALAKIREKLAKFGIAASDVNNAAFDLLAPRGESVADEPADGTQAVAKVESHVEDDSLESRILERMVDTVPAAANGALVSLRELRRSMDFHSVEKTTFDQAVLHLADQGKVALHRHDFPAGLSAEDRAELVTDGTGDFYVGIAMRQ
jgi:hypothetical protein